HYAASLTDLIRACPHQELATHTLSHFYCLAPGQTLAAFSADLRAACLAARRHGTTPASIVFPRNQVNPDYLEACRSAGLLAYRGNNLSPFYREPHEEPPRSYVEVIRFLDRYLPLTRGHSYPLTACQGDGPPYNVRASRLLKPYRKSLRWLEPLRRW